MTRFRVLGTNPTNFTVSSLDRTFAILPQGARLRADTPPGMAKASEMVLLSLPQADSP